MDALLESINIRSLLPSSDPDESSPLSASDLLLLIDRLDSRSLHIKNRILRHVVSHHRDFADIFSRCSLAASRSAASAAALSEALGLLSGRPTDSQIRDLAREIAGKRRELEDRRAALALLRTISGLRERLQDARAHLSAGRTVEASEAVWGLKEGLLVDVAVKDREEQPVGYEILRKEWMELFNELQEFLASSVENAVQFEVDNDKGIVKCKLSISNSNRVELNSALKAMELACIMDYGLAKVADLMIKHVINPAISSGFSNIYVELHDDFVEKPEAILYLVQSFEYQEHPDGSTLYSRLIQIMKFIYKFICFENSKWMQCFGRLTWSRMSDFIISNFISKVSADDASNVVPFQSITESIAKFESALKEMMFISTTDKSEERLSNFAHNIEVLFASRRRNEILAEARNMLLHFDYILPPTTAVAESCEYVTDLLFQPERRCVSKTVLGFMKLVHEALNNVCFSSTRVAREFYHAARDVLLLYKAIVPIKQAKQLDCISQLAIVIYNDCYYLSQEILGLAFEYRADFPNGLKKNAAFIDIASIFRQMSLNILGKQVQLVDKSLMEAIDGAYGFQDTHQTQQEESAKFSIDQVVFILEKVRIMWEPVMSPSAYSGTMCTLLDSVFSRVTKDMLLLDDIAAEETLQLQRLIHMMFENLAPLFESLIADTDQNKESLNDHSWVWLDAMVPSLCKLRKLADLLDMPLKAITTIWETGELVNCGFTSSEVQNLIKAIFTDSPLRKECLWIIGSTNS